MHRAPHRHPRAIRSRTAREHGPGQTADLRRSLKTPIPENDELDRFNPVFINFSIFIPEKSLGERTITCQTCHDARRSLLVGASTGSSATLGNMEGDALVL